jgi:transposase
MEQMPPAWWDRDGQRVAKDRLPAGRAERYTLAETIGADGLQLLPWLYTPPAPPWPKESPAVAILRQVWVQQFSTSEGVLRWRSAEELPPAALMICSPDDAEARSSKKRSPEWTGYRAPLTETGDDASPHLIPDGHPTPVAKPVQGL